MSRTQLVITIARSPRRQEAPGAARRFNIGRSAFAGHRTAARGMAALTVVMVLFFVMALVAAYTNRNLIFEQRISANGYRATRALEAADAGVEWAVAMLNAGRISNTCAPADANAPAAITDFRSRYTTPAATDANGEGAFDVPWGPLTANRTYPTCVIVGGVPRCACPAMGEAPAAIVVPADGRASAFRITFLLFNGDTPRGGAIQFISRGCANPGANDTACFAQNNDLPDVDSSAAVITTVGLVRALPVAPKATLTAGGAVTANLPGRLQVANGDFESGMAIQSGGDVSASPASTVAGAAGTEPASVGMADARLVVKNARDENGVLWSAGLLSAAGQAQQRWFRSLFVLDTESYRRQPAVLRMDCQAGCTLNDLNPVLALNPRNPIWVEGNLDLNVDGANLGSAVNPLMLVVNGTLTVSRNVIARGFVHANQIDWTAAGGTWDGAMVSATTFDATGVATLRYDKAALDIIRLRYGSLVRAPGSWNLF